MTLSENTIQATRSGRDRCEVRKRLPPSATVSPHRGASVGAPGADGIGFVRLGGAPGFEIFAGEELAASRRALLHDQLEFRLVLRGAVEVVMSDFELVAGPGSLLRFAPQQLHLLKPQTTDGYSFLALHWGFDACDGAETRMTALSAQDGFGRVDVSAELLARARRLRTQIVGSRAHTAARERLLLPAAHELATCGARAPTLHVARSSAATRVAPIERALAYLGEHFLREITLQELAAAAGLSKFHFVRLFSAVVGATPHRYQLLLRIGRARRLLRDGEGIAPVAQHTGFFDQSHFTACFREIVGVTPGRYQVHAGAAHVPR